MAKIYVKTIFLVVVCVCLLLARLGLLNLPVYISAFCLDFLIGIIIVAVLINEKLTRGERWTRSHYLLLFLYSCLWLFICVL